MFIHKVSISTIKSSISKKSQKFWVPYDLPGRFHHHSGKVSSILIGCVQPAPANRRRCWPRRGGVGKIRGPTGVSAVLEWQGGGGGHGFFYLLDLPSRFTRPQELARNTVNIQSYFVTYIHLHLLKSLCIFFIAGPTQRRETSMWVPG